MAQIIVGQPSPSSWDVISGAIDRYQQHRAQQQQMDLQRQGLAQQQQQIDQTGAYQDRMAKIGEAAQRLAADQQAYAQAKERWGAAYDQAIAPALASGRPEDFQAAQSTLVQLTTQYPEFGAFAGATALRLKMGQLPADKERATTQDTFNAVADQVNRGVKPPSAATTPTYSDLIDRDPSSRGRGIAPIPNAVPGQSPTLTPLAAQSRQPDTPQVPVNPQVMDLFHKRNFGNQGMSQQSMTNLEAQDPRAGGYSSFLRRQTGDLTTAAEDKAAATQITTTGMQEAGAMERAKLMAAAKTAAPSAATVQPGTREYGIAQDLSSGKLTFDQFQKLFGRGNNPMKAAIYSTATQINPNFDPSTFELGYKFAGNKGIRQQVASADNALKMIPEAIDISDKATRLGPTAINKLIMSGGVMLGGKKYTDAQTLQKAFGDEISGALGFGSATDMTRELGLSMADLNFSSPNFRSAMQIVETFLKNKRGSLVNQMGPYGNTVDQFSGGNPGKGNPLGLTPPK